MLTLTCDLCERAIKETGYLCDLVEARLIYGEDTHPHIAERGQILSIYMCSDCAAQVQRRIHSIRAKAHGGITPSEQAPGKQTPDKRAAS